MSIAAGNLPHEQAQAIALGPQAVSQQPSGPYAYQDQWNFAVQRPGQQHVHPGGLRWCGGRSSATFLVERRLSPVSVLVGSSESVHASTNPFYGVIKTGTLSAPTVIKGALLQPFPAYGVGSFGGNIHEVQAMMGSFHLPCAQFVAAEEARQNGTLLVGYSFSKILTNTSTETDWLNGSIGVGNNNGITPQNSNDMQAEKALSNFDVHQRLTVSYSLTLPFGAGHRFLNGDNAVVKKLHLRLERERMTTYQEGVPLGLTASPNPLSTFGYFIRPNVLPGCDKTVSGSNESRLNNWFNTSCFAVPAPFTLGNETATDPRLRGPGIANYDFSLIKETPITERVNFEFRAEAFNLFNRPQFSNPNTTISPGNVGTGVISSQVNQPRQIQFAARITF